MRRLLLIAHKETRHVVRDVRTVYLALGIPLVMLLLFGYALTMDVTDVPLVVVDGDHSQASRDLVAAFEHSTLFSVVDRPADPSAILPAFRRNEAKAALVIAAGFGKDIDRNEVAKAQLVLDGTDANVASIAMGYAAAIAQSKTVVLVADALARQGVSLGQTPRPSPRAGPSPSCRRPCRPRGSASARASARPSTCGCATGSTRPCGHSGTWCPAWWP